MSLIAKIEKESKERTARANEADAQTEIAGKDTLRWLVSDFAGSSYVGHLRPLPNSDFSELRFLHSTGDLFVFNAVRDRIFESRFNRSFGAGDRLDIARFVQRNAQALVEGRSLDIGELVR
ncbi:MAG: hypothetical protein U1E49_05520 [Hyphomicrobiaceae bacterium]